MLPPIYPIVPMLRWSSWLFWFWWRIWLFRWRKRLIKKKRIAMETMAVMTAAISQIPMSDDVEDPPNVSSKQMNSQHDEPIRKDLQSGGGVHKTARHAWNERKNKREIPGKLTQAKCVRPPLHVHFRRCTTCTYQCQAEQSASHVEWCVPCNRGTRQPHFQFQYCLPYYLT